MDLSDIRKLVRLMIRAELSEIEIDDTNAGVRVHLKRGSGGPNGDALIQPVVQVVPGGSPAPAPPPPAAVGGSTPFAGEENAGPPAGTVSFESPMVGTFYRASAPDAVPFVDPGTKVDDDTVLCIIEAMKVMNEIKAEMRGEIVDILVENGEPIEFGQPLFHIKKS